MCDLDLDKYGSRASHETKKTFHSQGHGNKVTNVEDILVPDVLSLAKPLDRCSPGVE